MSRIEKREPPPLRLGEWLAFFGVSQTAAAQAAGCGQSYIANMIAGRKKHPDVLILLALSDFLGITVNDFYKRPPNRAEAQVIADLSAAAQQRILHHLRRKT